jgi:hypothetical protein
MKNLQTITNYLTFWSCDMVMDQAKRSTVQLPPIHEIETRIEYHDTVIKQFETKVIQSSYNNSILENKIDMLSISLDSAKQSS